MLPDPRTDPGGFLEALFRESCARLAPHALVARGWEAITRAVPFLGHAPAGGGRTILIGCGKAAAALADALSARIPGPLSGLVACPAEYARAWRDDLEARGIAVMPGGHPLPDEHSMAAARRALELCRSAGPRDRVLFLVTGGGSAAMALPQAPLSLAHKRDIVSHLILSGADIREINTVRRHLSLVKGGRLAAAAAGAGARATIVISDVVGDDPAAVASGPSVPDPTTRAEAAAILERWRAPHEACWRRALADPAGETPKRLPADPVLVLARGRDLLAAAETLAQDRGLAVAVLGEFAGDAAALARRHAQAIRQATGDSRTPLLLLSGGEATVRVTQPGGRGGPNLVFLAELARLLEPDAPVYALAADSDGRDGVGGHAGGVIWPGFARELAARGIDIAALLAADRSHDIFATAGALLCSSPIALNVNDFRAVLLWAREKKDTTQDEDGKGCERP